jgi:hypothetical protein
MSRTTRRNKQHLIDSYVGTRDECLRDPWWRGWYGQGVSPELAYDRLVARYTRDHRSGRFGVPNWYRREHGVFRTRRKEKIAIHQHLRTDSWDNHLPENRSRDHRYYWW